jgi:hypothetical protein
MGGTALQVICKVNLGKMFMVELNHFFSSKTFSECGQSSAVQCNGTKSSSSSLSLITNGSITTPAKNQKCYFEHYPYTITRLDAMPFIIFLSSPLYFESAYCYKMMELVEFSQS